MARMEDLVESEQAHMRDLALTTYDTAPWVDGPPLSERRVAIVTTAGLGLRGDDGFGLGAADYRVIPAETDSGDILMSHISVNFDRTGFQDDVNVVFPIDRLRELKDAGVIGSIASRHFGFMGATPPMAHAEIAKDLAGAMKGDKVDGVLLAGV